MGSLDRAVLDNLGVLRLPPAIVATISTQGTAPTAYLEQRWSETSSNTAENGGSGHGGGMRRPLGSPVISSGCRSSLRLQGGENYFPLFQNPLKRTIISTHSTNSDGPFATTPSPRCVASHSCRAKQRQFCGGGEEHERHPLSVAKIGPKGKNVPYHIRVRSYRRVASVKGHRPRCTPSVLYQSKTKHKLIACNPQRLLHR